MTGGVSLGVWKYGRGDATFPAAALIEAGGLVPPDLHVEVIGDQGEYVTVAILSGALTDPTAILYVESRGVFEVVSVEPWPECGRFLVLRPYTTSE
jgi:hypothetical protein